VKFGGCEQLIQIGDQSVSFSLIVRPQPLAHLATRLAAFLFARMAKCDTVKIPSFIPDFARCIFVFHKVSQSIADLKNMSTFNWNTLRYPCNMFVLNAL
jgi:hypothetical protein